MEYSIDYGNIAKKVKAAKAKNVLLQLPEGLKPDFKEIAGKIESLCNCNVFLWGNSCFGACDLPLSSERAGIDLIIHVGHEPF